MNEPESMYKGAILSIDGLAIPKNKYDEIQTEFPDMYKSPYEFPTEPIDIVSIYEPNTNQNYNVLY